MFVKVFFRKFLDNEWFGTRGFGGDWWFKFRFEAMRSWVKVWVEEWEASLVCCSVIGGVWWLVDCGIRGWGCIWGGVFEIFILCVV